MAGAAARRAAEGRRPGRRRGPAERRKVQPYQCDSWAGAGHRHRYSGHHARSYRGAAGARRRADPADRHRRAARHRRRGRSDRRRARASAGRGAPTCCCGSASPSDAPDHPRADPGPRQGRSAGRATRRTGRSPVSSVTGEGLADLLERIAAAGATLAARRGRDRAQPAPGDACSRRRATRSGARRRARPRAGRRRSAPRPRRVRPADRPGRRRGRARRLVRALLPRQMSCFT